MDLLKFQNITLRTPLLGFKCISRPKCQSSDHEPSQASERTHDTRVAGSMPSVDYIMTLLAKLSADEVSELVKILIEKLQEKEKSLQLEAEPGGIEKSRLGAPKVSTRTTLSASTHTDNNLGTGFGNSPRATKGVNGIPIPQPAHVQPHRPPPPPRQFFGAEAVKSNGSHCDQTTNIFHKRKTIPWRDHHIHIKLPNVSSDQILARKPWLARKLDTTKRKPDTEIGTAGFVEVVAPFNSHRAQINNDREPVVFDGPIFKFTFHYPE